MLLPDKGSNRDGALLQHAPVALVGYRNEIFAKFSKIGLR